MTAVPSNVIRRRLNAALLVFLAIPVPAIAHPPYEHLDRVTTDDSGRSLYLYKSYTDGIFFTDPVKLVVRDADDRMLAETQYGRDISVICWRARSCVVFRYDGFIPVLPENVWRLEGGLLRETGSLHLVVLGVIAPFWTHPGGYSLSIVSVWAPLPILWLLWRSRRSGWRSTAMAAAGVGGMLYGGIWLYVVVLLSYLSLPLVLAASLISGGALVLTRQVASRVGIADSPLLKIAHAWSLAVAAVGGIGVIWAMWMMSSAASYSASISFEEPAVQAPLTKAGVTRVGGVAHEVFVTLANDVKLRDVVNLDLFEGFDANMTREEAEKRLGSPSGRWTDPAFNVRAIYYDRRDGRVSVVRQGGSAWSIVGYPSACRHDYVFRDARLRDQILHWLPPRESIDVHVLRPVGFGGLTVGLNRSSCTNLVLTARDEERGSN